MLVRKISLAALFLVGAVLTGASACEGQVSVTSDQPQPVAVSDMNAETAIPTSYEPATQAVQPAEPTQYVGFDQMITEYQNQPAPARLDSADKATIGKPAVQYRVDREMQHGY